MSGVTHKLDYCRAAEDLGFAELTLLCPPEPCVESLRLRDAYAAQLAKYRGEVSS
jgi:hypothetical protein